jgi:hypothetical protein
MTTRIERFLLRFVGAQRWFNLGYKTALDDVERTGLRPFREDAKDDAARRAWRFYAP